MNARPFRRVADLLTSRARGAGPTPNRMSSRDRQALARLDVLRSSVPVENIPLDEAPAGPAPSPRPMRSAPGC